MTFLYRSHFCFRLRCSFIITVIALISATEHICLGHQLDVGERGRHGRNLLSFKETPVGSNATFECAPSGPCVPCQYSEKNDDKYRCSETGYRIPLKCVPISDVVKKEKSKRPRNSRSVAEVIHNYANEHLVLHYAENVASISKPRTLLDGVSSKMGDPQSYITYRSCIAPAGEERLSVLGFEVLIMGMLLVSGSFVFLRRRWNASLSGGGGVRIQSNVRLQGGLRTRLLHGRSALPSVRRPLPVDGSLVWKQEKVIKSLTGFQIRFED